MDRRWKEAERQTALPLTCRYSAACLRLAEHSSPLHADDVAFTETPEKVWITLVSNMNMDGWEKFADMQPGYSDLIDQAKQHIPRYAIKVTPTQEYQIMGMEA